ncbi:hypothetical protein [Clostridium sp. BL-8]|uniref:hypothetical protein n=1 Tax=Clostridium sp. BL-8 TaxID=349938 RepID=UPI00098C6C2C|nr:hypothetical protein [Clostridium sp. BL-8]OOM80467.1 hypothetical protein CLOBL_09470 [Clostridium sp. BL-8]
MEGRDLRIKLMLEKVYPNNEVVGLTKKGNKLYYEISNEAKKKNLNVIDYIESLGFVYVRGWKEELTESEIVNLLNGLFPQKIIESITEIMKKNSALYSSIKNVSKENGIKVKDYIERLGFTYDSSRKKKLDENEAVKLLNQLFSDKSIKNISDISKNNSTLYNSISRISKEKNMDISDYLESLGFEHLNKNINSNYDMKAINILCRDYDVNMSEMARIVGTSKQNLDSKLKSKKIKRGSYEKYEFTDEELNLIVNVIRERRHYYEDNSNEIVIKIYHGKYDIGINAILYKEHLKIKICFDLSDSVLKELDKFGFNKYQEQDMEMLNTIYSEYNSFKIYDEDNEEGLTTIDIDNSKLKSRLRSRAKYLNMNLNDYAKSLGFIILNRSKYTDEYIKKLLEKYKLDNNIVKIPSGTSDYISIFRMAKIRGYKGLEEFITAYGFKYERIREVNSIDEKYKEIIQNRYVVENKKIYINSFDPFYNRIRSFCYKHEISLNDFLSNLGFERIDNTNELPESYIQYDWKAEEAERLKDVFSDENIILFLDEIANENNEIYIDTTSQAYSNLWKIANIRDMSINDLIDMLGYKRIYAWDNHKIQRPCIADVEIEYDKNSIDGILDELQKIQGSLEKIENGNEKVKRNQTLVKKIKKLYHNKCQLCCPDDSGFSVPPIETENGELYVEVHHIKQVSEAFKSDDESDKLIDNYKNVIVVCSYHHKYLHYHLGGFKEIIQKEDGQLYFKSKLGETLKIFTNYHLTSTNTDN